MSAMQVKSAVYADGRLCLEIAAREGRRFAYEFKPGEYEIKRKGKKRSLDANAYAWVLIHKIAEAVNISPVKVYRNTICDMGNIAHRGSLPDTDIQGACRDWEAHGIGWQTVVLDSNRAGWKNVLFYPGSSQYDTAQMSRFIDLLIQEARNLDIETLPPEKLEAMKLEWK